VQFEGSTFRGIRLQRGTFGAFDFLTLSGGAKEQLAAAVRLAIAEIVAQDHGGCLPVVFDDAFAYSDPKRVETLQGMLDLAAERGLQVIVLTCNPSDYAGLGAKLTQLDFNRREPSQTSLKIGQSMADKDGESSECARQVVPSNESHEADVNQFLAALRDSGGKAGNKSMQDTLGWAEERYEQVKAVLVESGLIVPGRGRGGSVAFPMNDDDC
jgi:hypothetical protein